MKHANIIRYSVLALLAIVSFSCRKVFETAKWEPATLLPLANADLSLQDLLSDTTQFKKDSSGLAVVVFKQNLDSLTLDVLDTFSVPPFYRNFKLDSLRLEVEPFVQRFTLGQLADSLAKDPSNALLGVLLKAMHGQKLSSLPPEFQSQIPSSLSLPLGELPLSLDQYFESAVLKSGILDLSIANGFPMKVTRLDFAISNAANRQLLLQETGITIDTNEYFAKTYDLAGKSVEGQLLINVSVLDLLTDKEAVIDTNDAIEIKMTFSNLQVQSATAAFPGQDVIVDRQAVALEDMGDMELKEAIIEEGAVVMDVVSTLQDSIFMTFVMPKTTYNGQPLVFNGAVPPATATSNSTIRLEVPVNDYRFNLSSAPDYHNRFLYDFRAYVKNTGKKVYLSLTDSIVVNVYLRGVRPKYVRGYLGKLDTVITSSLTTDVFTSINAQSLSPERVNMSLHIENGLGVSGRVNFDYLKASNTKNETVDASDPEFVKKDLPIGAATYPPFKESVTNIKSSAGSNFANLVSILPSKFDYSIKATVGGDKDTNSFVFSQSRLKPSLEIEVPLHLSFSGLTLRDTVSIDPSSPGLETSHGAIKLLATNGFPFSATIRITFLPAPSFGLISLHGDARMEPADVDPITGRVTNPKFSKINIPFQNFQLYEMLKSQQVAIEAVFDTPPGQPVKIYSDYTAKMNLVVQVGPQITR